MSGKRVLGLLYLLAGGLPLIAVANPALFSTWAAEQTDAMATFAAHEGAWLFTTVLLGLGFAVGVPAVVLLSLRLRTPSAWLSAVAYVAGAVLMTVTFTYQQTVTRPLLGQPLPDWYLPLTRWISGLDTVTLGLLWPLADLGLGIVVLRTRTLPRWSGWVLVAAGVVLLGQMAAFGGVIPAPMFMASVAVGIAILMSPAAAAPETLVAAGHAEHGGTTPMSTAEQRL